MQEIGLFTILVVAANALLTFQGLSKTVFFDKYVFHIDRILISKEYIRMISSGFLHVNWPHFAFNMLTLYFFSDGLEMVLGVEILFLFYFASLLGGNLLSLFIHRNHGDYRAVGASGAVSGIVFACIALFPGMNISFIFLPIGIPSWVYGLAYVLYSIYGIRTQKDNIGHDAHLGGGIVGVIAALAYNPAILQYNLLPIALILIPSLVFLYLLISRPEILFVPNPFAKSQGMQTLDDRYNQSKKEEENELNKLLDKIHKKGIESLSAKEKDRLKKLSKR